jgi:hypothetical protein
MEPEARVQKKQKNRNMSQKFGTGSSRYLVAHLTLEVYQTMVPKVNRLIPTSFSWIIHILENHWKPSNIPNFLGCNQKPSSKKRSHEVNTIKTNLWNWFGPSWTACAQTRIAAVKSRHVSKAFPPRFSVLMGTTSTSTERRHHVFRETRWNPCFRQISGANFVSRLWHFMRMPGSPEQALGVRSIPGAGGSSLWNSTKSGLQLERMLATARPGRGRC